MEIYRDFLMFLIEETRMNLNHFARYRSLTDPSIVELSQRLDKLLNEYHKVMTGKWKIAS